MLLIIKLSLLKNIEL